MTWSINPTSPNYAPLPSFINSTATTATTIALSSAYTYATSGAAFMFNFLNSENANLTTIWLKISAYSGTWGSTDGHINLEIREGLNASNIPGTSLTGSANLTLDGTTTGWVKITGLSISLTAGKFYSVVIGDADGGATNFVTLVQKYSTTAGTTATSGTTVSTANGYNTAGTNVGGGVACAIKVGSLYYGGNGFDTVATLTSGTYERGVKFTAQEDCLLLGYFVGQDTSVGMTLNNIFKLYDVSTNPGGSTLASFTNPGSTLGGGTAPAVNIFPLPVANQYNIVRGKTYRAVIKPAAASTTPRQATINGSPDSELLSVLLPLNGAQFCKENAGVWDDTATNSTLMFGPCLVPRSRAFPIPMTGGIIG